MLTRKISFLNKSTRKKDLNAPLTLTSLIDAFSILVIFLIVSGSNPKTIDTNNKIKLPKVASSEAVKPTLRISVSSDGYYFENKKMSFTDLIANVKANKSKIKDQRAILEADKNTPFEIIEPVMRIFADLDIEMIHLAVEAKKTL
jgi:biopolymer transport protein ExbD